MEALSRLIVVCSAAGAAVAHALLVGQTVPAVPWLAAAAFAASAALARFSLPLALGVPLVLTYAAPALVMVGLDAPGHHDVLVWIAALAGPLLTTSDWSRWHTPRAWTPLLAAWALVVAATWPIVAGREIDFSLVAARTFDTPNGLGAGAPPLVAAGITGVALGQLVGVLWIDWLWARFGAERLARAERLVFLPLLASALLAAIAGVYQRYVDLDWLGVDVWTELRRAGSLLLDANSFGMAAAIWAPLALVLARRLRYPLWAGAASAALLVAGVWSSGSRTALFTAAIGLAAAVAAEVRRARAWPSRLVPIGLVAAAAALMLVVPVVSGDRTNPLTRLIETLPGDQTGGVAQVARSLWNRDGFGLASVRVIADHPWTGVGIGAFLYLSTDFAYLVTGALPTADNAQNWWRQQIAELGVLGAAPSVAFSLLILLSIVRRASGARGEAHGTAAIVLPAVLAAIGLISLVGVATQHPALWFTFATVLYWFGALAAHGGGESARAPHPRAIWLGAFALAAIVALGQWQSATGDLRVPMRALRFGFPYAYGFTAPDGDNVPWTGRHAVAVLRAEHAYFAVTAEAPRLDEPVRVRIWRERSLVVDVDSSGLEPIHRVLALPAGRTFLMIETDVSRTRPDGRGLRLTGEWLREAPADAAPGTVVP